jgi:hypothetical protein
VGTLIKAALIFFCALLSAALTVAMVLSWAAIGTCENDCAGGTTFAIVKVLFFVGAAGCLASVAVGGWWASRRIRSVRRHTDR